MPSHAVKEYFTQIALTAKLGEDGERSATTTKFKINDIGGINGNSQ